MKKLLLMLSIIILGTTLLSAQEDSIDEDAMFADTESVVSNVSREVDDLMEKEELVFSGNFLTRLGYNIMSSWFKGDTPGDTNKLSASLEGNFNIDLRLKKGFKAHMGVKVNYSDANARSFLILTNSLSPQEALLLGKDTLITFPEFFVDMNIDQKVYFRLGKQVIKWGRGNLWNPSDLINVDRQSFLDSFQVKNGVSGIKMHIPVGTVFNFYTFFDISGSEAINDVAAAAKVEFLWGRTEMGFSAWAKENKLPVYGFDFSSRIRLTSIYGEASFSEGENRSQIGDLITSIPFPIYETVQDTTNFVTRVTLGFNRSFNYIYDNRVIITGELYFNSTGYEENLFTDPDKINFMYMNGLYKPYDHAKYYASLTALISHFFDQNLSWSASGLANLIDGSLVVTSRFTYQPVINFNLGLAFYAFLGPEAAEFTYGDRGGIVEFTAQYIF